MIPLNDEQRNQFKALAEQFQLDLLILFGSQVTGQTHAESDYDVGYVADGTLTMTEEGELIIRLTGIFRLRDERLINLVNLQRVGSLQKHLAAIHGKVLFEQTPTTFAQFRATAFKQYVETEPLAELKAKRLGVVL